QALGILGTDRHEELRHQILCRLGGNLTYFGDLETAERYLRAAFEYSSHAGSERARGRTGRMLAWFMNESGRPEEALDLLERVSPFLEPYEDQRLLGSLDRATAWLATGRSSDVETMLNSVHDSVGGEIRSTSSRLRYLRLISEATGRKDSRVHRQL